MKIPSYFTKPNFWLVPPLIIPVPLPPYLMNLMAFLEIFPSSRPFECTNSWKKIVKYMEDRMYTCPSSMATMAP